MQLNATYIVSNLLSYMFEHIAFKTDFLCCMISHVRSLIHDLMGPQMTTGMKQDAVLRHYSRREPCWSSADLFQDWTGEDAMAS